MGPKVVGIIDLFIACPGDLTEERKVIDEYFAGLNQTFSRPYSRQFRLNSYKDVPPGMGRGQGLINKKIEQCMYALFMYWKKWGSPTGENGFTSGTDEEFRVCVERYKDKLLRDIAILFKKADVNDVEDEVKAFRSEVETEFTALYAEFASHIELLFRLQGLAYHWLEAGRLEPEELKNASEAFTDADPKEKSAHQPLEPDEPNLDADDLNKYREANRLYNGGDVNAAVALLDELYAKTNQPTIAFRAAFIVRKERSNKEAVFRYEAIEREVSYIPKMTLGLLHRNLAEAYYASGDFEKYNQRIALARELIPELPPLYQATVEGVESRFARIMFDLDRAEELATRVYELSIEHGDLDEAARSLVELCFIFEQTGQDDKLRERVVELHDIALKQRYGSRLSSSYNFLAGLERRSGNFQKADELHRKGLSVAYLHGDLDGYSTSLGNYGIWLFRQKKLNEARSALVGALHLDQLRHATDGIAVQTGHLLALESLTGDIERTKILIVFSESLSSTDMRPAARGVMLAGRLLALSRLADRGIDLELVKSRIVAAGAELMSRAQVVPHPNWLLPMKFLADAASKVGLSQLEIPEEKASVIVKDMEFWGI